MCVDWMGLRTKSGTSGRCNGRKLMTLPTATTIRTATTTEIQSQSGEEAIRARHLLQKGDLLLN